MKLLNAHRARYALVHVRLRSVASKSYRAQREEGASRVSYA